MKRRQQDPKLPGSSALVFRFPTITNLKEKSFEKENSDNATLLPFCSGCSRRTNDFFFLSEVALSGGCDQHIKDSVFYDLTTYSRPIPPNLEEQGVL